MRKAVLVLGEVVYEKSLYLLTQFFCEPKAALKTAY